MEATTLTSYSFFAVIAIVVGVFVWFVVAAVMARKNTVPSGANEGFQGPAVGVSTLPCGQESADAVAIMALFSNKESSTEEGVPDLKELATILSKMCCMKHDLMSPTQVVSSMMYLPYSNTHDRENPADTVARCFTKSMPPRDLDITFGTWRERGHLLINRLATSYNLTKGESERVKNSFNGVYIDVFSIAKGACVASSDGSGSKGSPRDPKGFMKEEVKELGAYDGYY